MAPRPYINRAEVLRIKRKHGYSYKEAMDHYLAMQNIYRARVTHERLEPVVRQARVQARNIAYEKTRQEFAGHYDPQAFSIRLAENTETELQKILRERRIGFAPRQF